MSAESVLESFLWASNGGFDLDPRWQLPEALGVCAIHGVADQQQPLENAREACRRDQLLACRDNSLGLLLEPREA